MTKKNCLIKKILMVNPHFHWRIIIIFTMMIVFLLIVFSVYTLYRIKTEQIFKNNNIEKDTPILLKEESLKNVNDFFSKKELELNKLKENFYFYKDPSIR